VTTRDLDLSEDGAIWQAIIAWSDARGYLTAGEPGTAAAKVDQAIRDAFASSSTVQQVGADALDAARYRWLRSYPNNVNAAVYGPTGGLLRRDDYLDAAIDAAIASSPKSEQGDQQ
jgi:hypothetical protein